ncbi:hypothetical protein ACN38_g36 [Penicillium nordicum]|uniref:Uncharacterized protein n=1 Tax=Penicillium nordicum TaxID=229535 RepID=A0A0M8PJI1_9EURO|nr:hypothetical protein ACN38_g36 [Penicillium nordicum]
MATLMFWSTPAPHPFPLKESSGLPLLLSFLLFAFQCCVCPLELRNLSVVSLDPILRKSRITPPVIVTLIFELQKQTHQQLQWSSRNCSYSLNTHEGTKKKKKKTNEGKKKKKTN